MSIFKIGKYYKHAKTGGVVHILTVCYSDLRGEILVSETPSGLMVKSTSDTSHESGWFETTKEEWTNHCNSVLSRFGN